MLNQSTLLGASTQSSSRLRLALDPVRDTQAIFRTVLMALSWPGSVQQMPVAADGAPGNRWAGALLITLLDHETPFAVTPSSEAEAIVRFIRQHTNAPVAELAEAEFLFTSSETLDPELLLQVRRGTLSYPDESATLVLAVPSLDQTATAGLLLALAGPGVPAGRTLRVQGLTEAFFAARADAVRQYPRGVDLLLTDAEGRIAGLPRTTSVRLAEQEA